jgi:hypothetical protein
MPIPIFLQNNQVPTGALGPVGVPAAPHVLAPAPGGAAPNSGAIAFPMQTQSQNNWCWAAVSSSVSRFFSAASTWTQCRIAETTLGITGCCNNPPAHGCDVPYYLDLALQTTNNLVSWSGPPTKTEIAAEIDTNKRPLCLRVEWSGGAGHFIVIAGFAWQTGSDFLDIEDPYYGLSTYTIASMNSGMYQLGNGTWTHSFYTKP